MRVGTEQVGGSEVSCAVAGRGKCLGPQVMSEDVMQCRFLTNYSAMTLCAAPGYAGLHARPGRCASRPGTALERLVAFSNTRQAPDGFYRA